MKHRLLNTLTPTFVHLFFDRHRHEALGGPTTGHYTYSDAKVEGELKFTLQGEADVKADRKLYGSEENNYDEYCVVIKDFPEDAPRNQRFYRSTNHHVNALKHRYVNGHYPVAVEGLIKTWDNFLVYGVRALGQGANHLLPVPAGRVSSLEGDILFNSFFEEAEEELGLTQSDLRDPRLIGHQIDNGTGVYALHFVFTAETKITLKELQEVHAESLHEHRMLERDWHCDLDSIRSSLRGNGYVVDAWENAKLIGIPDDPSVIGTIIDQQPGLLDARFYPNSWRRYGEHRILNIGYRPLLMLLEHRDYARRNP